MRIACLALPSFPLQVHLRRAPHLAGTSFAVVDPEDRARRVVACSRAAWKAGVRPNMTAAVAHSLDPRLSLHLGDAARCYRALEAVADSLLSFSRTVDITGASPRRLARHQSLYLEVPTGTRGSAFGSRVLVQLARQDFRGRIGIADDRFASWVASLPEEGSGGEPGSEHGDAPPFALRCTTVPRGGSAAFLAPRPLSLLPLERHLRQLLERSGVATLGDFAALPPPSLSRRWSESGIDLQALARGDDPRPLCPFPGGSPVVESLEPEQPVVQRQALGCLLRPVFDRICERLRCRGRAVAKLVVQLSAERGDTTELVIAAAPATLSGRRLVDLARAQIARIDLAMPVASVEVIVAGEGEPEPQELDLFATKQSAGVFRLAASSLGPSVHRRTRRSQRGKKNRRRDWAVRHNHLRGLFD